MSTYLSLISYQAEIQTNQKYLVTGLFLALSVYGTSALAGKALNTFFLVTMISNNFTASLIDPIYNFWTWLQEFNETVLYLGEKKYWACTQVENKIICWPYEVHFIVICQKLRKVIDVIRCFD